MAGELPTRVESGEKSSAICGVTGKISVLPRFTSAVLCTRQRVPRTDSGGTQEKVSAARCYRGGTGAACGSSLAGVAGAGFVAGFVAAGSGGGAGFEFAVPVRTVSSSRNTKNSLFSVV